MWGTVVVFAGQCAASLATLVKFILRAAVMKDLCCLITFMGKLEQRSEDVSFKSLCHLSRWLHRQDLSLCPRSGYSAVPRRRMSWNPLTRSCFSGMNPEASALLLKSNYQNIVEGTHKQLGLSYPAELSTNLTSKRTSHKIAEQGRRNRINSALAEIAALLPHNSGNGSDGGSSAAAVAAAAQASKASTVESAIEYIKELQKELADTKRELAKAEKQLAETNLEK